MLLREQIESVHFTELLGKLIPISTYNERKEQAIE